MIKRKRYFIISCLVLLLFFSFTFACNDVESNDTSDIEKDEADEYSVIIPELINPLTEELKEYFILTSDYLAGAMSQSEHKGITMDLVRNINLAYNEFEDITPSEEYKEVHKKFDETIESFSTCAVFLEKYVEEDNKESMESYLNKFITEVDFTLELLNDANKELNSITRSLANDQEILDGRSYEIIYKSFDRFDGAPTYYILINTQNLDNEDFKNIIKQLVIDITSDKGKKISIDIYDDESALEYGYIYDHGTFEEWESIVNDQDIINHFALHCIATFEGELNTGMYFNTLWFFIFSDQVDNILIDEYVDVIEFNP